MRVLAQQWGLPRRQRNLRRVFPSKCGGLQRGPRVIVHLPRLVDIQHIGLGRKQTDTLKT